MTFLSPRPAYLTSDDNFGRSLAAVGSDRVLIGAHQDDTGAQHAGAAYLLSTNGTSLTSFTNPTPDAEDFFGWSVAAVGSERVLVGAPFDDTGATDAGSGYLFSADGTLLTTFTNPTPANLDMFGSALAAIGSNQVLIGAPRDDTGGQDAGAAYLFNTSGALLTTFSNPTPEVGDNFGYFVTAVGSNRVLVSALYDNTGASVAGVAYLFLTDGTLLTTVTSPTPAADDLFGMSMTLLGNDQVIIGSVSDDTGTWDAGAAYLFALPSPPPSLVIIPAAPGNTTISWTPNTPGFVLQETEVLSPANWTNSLSASANPTVAPTTRPAKHFRLIKP